MNAGNAAPRKIGRVRKILGFLAEEWVVQLTLVVAVVTVVVDGFLSLGSSIA